MPDARASVRKSDAQVGPQVLRSAAERHQAGRELRKQTPRSLHGSWTPPTHRADPVQILIETGRDRIADLLPIRYDRMRQSAFAFLRGSAAIMAADLAPGPTSGLMVQACGDCHLANTAIAEQTGENPQHPLQVVARAYGIPHEPTR